jgi:pyruvate/2-oxoglutarate dehydrogenase complex dihydrolipoamide dehydrogenase (E3) component
MRQAGEDADRAGVDFAAVMRRMRERRADLAVHDSAQRLMRLGIDVFFGDAAFTAAREIIGQANAALARGATLNDLSAIIHPYPAQAEALRKAGDAHRRTRLTASVRRWLERYFRLTRW